MNVYRLRHILGQVGAYTGAVAVMIFALFPVYWILSTALKPNSEIFTREPSLIPRELTLEHFQRVLSGVLIPETTFWSFLGNSLIVTLGSVAVAALFAMLAAMAVARFKFKLRTAFILLLLLIQMVPVEALIITLFVNFHSVGQALDISLLGNLSSVIIVYTTVALPITILMMRSFVAAVPPELEEAAAIDGASRWTIFWRVMMPLVAPGLVAASIFAFITAWNEFLVAYTFLQNSSGSYTLPVSLRFYFGRVTTEWGAIMAASTLLTVPVMLFFLFVQRRLVAGLTLGAVKG
ncbi:carbohydrate ABC transporter permease [Spiractinospora alimapuensis]|uniref:carbohydrate ABC transporter permease n=1 Tax=Spiractinospora alimapuensis TaxID=2820884 RepID=UPI001F3E8015|nr:carbohydrate ABC transporter permease [Spiractinospora alimapuensis]QVQ53636.1 carbohydrate ABC transporter permease [Spiractinospora alimapuensis]